MIRLEFSINLNYEIDSPGSDFIFIIQASQTNHQLIVSESLSVNQDIPLASYIDKRTHLRLLRLRGMPGILNLAYACVVDLDHYTAIPSQIYETPISNLPGEILIYLYPSRYCQSDFIKDIAVKTFGNMIHGYSRVQAIQDWVTNHVSFCNNTSTEHTTAIDTYLSKTGVCRDFAHLMIALCRALNIPARFVTGIDYGSDRMLGPTDFHAYVEVYLDGRWYIFDPSGIAIPMGFVRLGTGRDAADTSIATIFGSVRGSTPIVSIKAIPNALGVVLIPEHVSGAISTDE